jgi:TolB protein
MHHRSILLAVGVCVLAALTALPAHAGFPGKNGKIAFVSYENDPDGDIHVINPDGSGEAVLAAHPGRAGSPSWSPDGKKIAFWWRPAGEQATSVYVMNADGSGLVRLAAGANPSWSPDGTKIAFTRSACLPTCQVHIFTMNADGSNEQLIAPGVSPAWAPDGSKIAFRSPSDDRIVAVMNPDGTDQVALHEGESPEWSPDAQKIAFTFVDWSCEYCSPLPHTHIRIMNRDGTGITAIPPTGWGVGWTSAWSPDGTRIAIYDEYGYEMFTVNPDGSGRSSVVPLGGESPNWQPIPINSYPRPKAATPIEATLVPAYTECTTPNRIHGPPLAYDSCSPPAQASDELTLGTPDANGKPVKGSGLVRYGVLSGDVRIVVELDDVYDGALSDYGGELRLRTALRITDKLNTPHPGGPGAATVSDSAFGATVPCAATADPNTGAVCDLVTSVNVLVPGTVIPGRRAVWELGEMQVYDGGPDGDTETVDDNSVFMRQGLFVP